MPKILENANSNQMMMVVKSPGGGLMMQGGKTFDTSFQQEQHSIGNKHEQFTGRLLDQLGSNSVGPGE